METSDFILWAAIVAAYVVTTGPMIIGFRNAFKREQSGKRGDHQEPSDSRDTLELSLSDTDWRALTLLAQDRQEPATEVAKQALRLGLEEMEGTVMAHLSPRDAERVAELVEYPPKPSANYIEAKERHDRMKRNAETGVQKTDCFLSYAPVRVHKTDESRPTSLFELENLVTRRKVGGFLYTYKGLHAPAPTPDSVFCTPIMNRGKGGESPHQQLGRHN